MSLYLYHYASLLSIFSCFWLFFKYIRQMDKSVKHLLVVILAISDLIFSTNHIFESYWFRIHFFDFNIGLFFDSFSMCFSIFWASAIAFIAYKNLTDRFIDLKALFTKVLCFVLVLALVWTLLVSRYTDAISTSRSLRFGPLVISLILTIVFYQKSINILRDHLQYEQKSISIYIRNLRYFSSVQLLTYGPLIVMTFLEQTFVGNIGVEIQYWVETSCTAFACLSGFLSVAVFTCQSGTDSDDEFERDDNSEKDLTANVLSKA